MEARIRESEFVLLVCTETYARRVEMREAPGIGKGVLWESNLIYGELYGIGTVTGKFVPIGFGPVPSEHIPSALRHRESFDVSDEAGYERLYRYLTDQPEIDVPDVGVGKTLPPLRDVRGALNEKVSEQRNAIEEGQIPPDYLFLNHTSFLREAEQGRLRETTGYPGNIYDIRVILDSFDPLAMSKVDYVRYELGEAWGDRNIQVVTTSENHFLLKDLAYGPPLVVADVFLKGQPQPAVRLYRFLTLWTSGPRLKSVVEGF